MKKTTLFVLMIATQSMNAQFFIDFNTGYAIPKYKHKVTNMSNFGNEKNFYSYYMKNVDTTIDKVTIHNNKLNPNEGLFINTNIGYQIKKWNFSLNASFLYNKNLVSDRGKNNLHSYYYYNNLNSTLINNDEEIYNVFYTKYLTLAPTISFKFPIKKISIIACSGLTFDFITLYKNEKKTINNLHLDSSGLNTDIYSEIIYYKYKRPVTVHYHAGLSLSYSFNINWSFLLNFDYHYFSPSFYNSNCNIEQYYSEKIYPDGSSIISKEIKKSIYEAREIYMSSFNFSIGIRYTFGKKEKKE